MTVLPHVITDRPDLQQNFDALMTSEIAMSALRLDRGASQIGFTAAASAVLAIGHNLGTTPEGILIGLGPAQLGNFYQAETESWTSTSFIVRLTCTSVVTGTQAFSWMAWAS